MNLTLILLGILQGIFEWIPISSEGITSLLSGLLIKEINPIELAIFLHIGTLFSAIVYYRKEWIDVITFKDKKLFRFLLISTAISLTVGFPVFLLIHNITVGSVLLAITGTGLILTSILHKKKIKANIPLSSASVITGILQGLSVIPGLSRSGTTIFGLSFSNLSPQQILKISYMMSVPVITAATIYLTIKTPLLLQTWPALIAAFITGIISLHIIIRLSQKINFTMFTAIFGLLCYIGAIILL